MALRTPLTDLLGIQHPVMLAGMASISGHELAAAVSAAGGIGSFGGVSMQPSGLRNEIRMLKEELERLGAPNAPWGVDLLLPKVGEGARKTNKDYTEGNLDEIIDIIIAEKATLFISAVGVPPVQVVEKLHAAGIVVANMIGAPHHVDHALKVGCDFVIAQGTEAGGHTGDVATMPLIPQCVDKVRGKMNFFGKPVFVVGAGGIYDGRGLASTLCLGAAGVWVGTRFIAAEEANSSTVHKKRVLEAKSVDTTRTIAFTGRPCRVMKTPYVVDWETNRSDEIKKLTSQGTIPFAKDVQEGKASPSEFFPSLMGQVAGAVTSIKPAKEIVHSMVQEAVASLQQNTATIAKL
mmetsp:Transcript_7778/g.16753  ORF Transcript_7778/g.16753 Transcript_7778/m.16753 type:complete len:349 (+) Transcript_7778:58-1104(+)